MNAAKSTGRGRKIPPEGLEHLRQELLKVDDDDVDGGVRGRFCYVTHRGDPLCRLEYTGDLEEWEFAIYRYTRGTYGDLPLAPSRGRVADLVDLALRAYQLR